MTSDKFYDVVIVGAGITGSIVGRRLAENGKRVLILEAGPGTGLEQDGFQSFLDRYYERDIKSPTAPYPHSPNAPVDEGGTYYEQEDGPEKYVSNYTRQAGGTTLHWMGTSLRFLPNDFRLHSLYGHGVDWPINYEDLQPYYRMAEWELGVAANVEDQEGLDPDRALFEPGYEYPMERVPQSHLDGVLDDLMQGVTVKVCDEEIDLAVSSTPASRNSTPRKNLTDPRDGRVLDGYYRAIGDPDAPDERGQRCQGNSSCIPICPVQAKYSALKTLRQAIDNDGGRVEVITQAVATRIEIEPASGRVKGIRYKKYQDPNQPEFTEHIARGTVYVIAAHAIESAKLLLTSNAANSSGLVGCNLMDHPFVLTWGLMPEPVGSYRGPGSTSGIPQLRDGNFRKAFAAFRIEIGNWGVDFPNGTPSSTLQSLVDRKSFGVDQPESIRQRFPGDIFGKQLRQEIERVVPRQFRLGFEFEQLPEKTNRVTIDPRYRDALGNYRPVISYKLDSYCKDGIVEAKRISDTLYARIGVEDETNDYKRANFLAAGSFEQGGKRYEYHGAGHAAGTHRMGLSRKDSVVDTDQRTWDHENLFLVGCGNFCTVGTANPTLTAAALAYKAADALIKELR